MVDLAKLTSQIAISGAAFAGFTLVFFGNALTAYRAYPVEHRGSVRVGFLFHGGISLAGFILAVFSVGTAISYHFFTCDSVAYTSLALLGVSAVLVMLAAILSYISVW